MKLSLFAALCSVAAASLCSPVRAGEATVAYEKKLDDGRRLVVSFKEIPFIPMTPEQKAAEMKRTGVVAIYEPVHLYRYGLDVVSSDGHGGENRQEVWSRLAGDLGEHQHNIDWHIVVFDVSLLPDSVVLLYKRDLTTWVEALPAGAAATPRPLRIVRDYHYAEGEASTGGRIEVSPDRGELTVVVRNTRGWSVRAKGVKGDRGYMWEEAEKVEQK